MGDIGCFSFYPTKNLGAIGDAGAVVTSDEKIATRIKELRQYGWDNQRSSREPGINSRIDEIQAAVLNVKIKKLDTNNIRRREIANLYNKKLSGLDIQLPNERNNTSHVYHLYVAKVNNRDEFMSFLEQQNINLGIHYPNAVHQNKGYLKKINTQETTLSNTEKLIKNIVSLPMYPELIDEEVDLVISAIKKFLK